MDDTEECIHLMDPASCTLCNGRAAKERKEAEQAPRTFPAKYEGQCPACDLPIYVGQMVAWREGRRAVHERCWS